MPFNPEAKDKNVRDIIEGPPRFESEKNPDTKNPETATRGTVQARVRPEQAHQIGITLLTIPKAMTLMKAVISEKLVHGELLTRLDASLRQGEVSKEPYGLMEEHIATVYQGDFLRYHLIQDGDDLAISFTKNTGDQAMRSFDNAVLADILNVIFFMDPSLRPTGSQEEETFVRR